MKKIIVRIEKYVGEGTIPVEVYYEGNHFVNVAIHRINSGFGHAKEKAIYGVNWGGYGSVGVEEAKEYVVLIRKAIQVCEKFNK